MLKRINSILFVICVVMVFTAQTNRPEDKGQQHAPAARPASHAPAVKSASQNNQNRPQVQVRRQAPVQAVRRTPPIVQYRQPEPQHQPARQEWTAPRVYAVPAPAPVNSNRLLNRQHHNNWQPQYNYYGNQYHFYPYVNIASIVELPGDCVLVVLMDKIITMVKGHFICKTNRAVCSSCSARWNNS